jgi:hypothetical protein
MILRYTNMTTKELRDYVLADPSNEEAFYAFIDRKHQEVPKPLEIELSDPDLESKTQSIIQSLTQRNIL